MVYDNECKVITLHKLHLSMWTLKSVTLPIRLPITNKYISLKNTVPYISITYKYK